ncbi:MAG: NADPH-dependent FMN reductase, partial [Sphingobacteriaceae bacterium]
MFTIIAGTNRAGSSTLKLAVYYQQKLTEKGIEAQVLSLEDLPDNFLKSDLYGKRSEAFVPIVKLINASEKFIFIMPEY